MYGRPFFSIDFTLGRCTAEDPRTCSLQCELLRSANNELLLVVVHYCCQKYTLCMCVYICCRGPLWHAGYMLLSVAVVRSVQSRQKKINKKIHPMSFPQHFCLTLIENEKRCEEEFIRQTTKEKTARESHALTLWP